MAITSTDYEQAFRRVIKLKNFYIHSLAYVLVNTLCFVVNLINTPGQLWFHWVLLVWGAGLTIHALSTFPIAASISGKTNK